MFFIAGSVTFAQEKPKEEEDFKKEITFDNKQYRVYNNWLSAGAGPSNNSNAPSTQFSIVANYSFHVKKEYLQFGVLLSGDNYGSYNTIQAHGCYGKRKETAKYNLSAFIGPSYTSGFLFLDSTYSNKAYKALGAYAEVQFIGKIKYDVGIGPSVFVDYNAKRTIIGLRLDLYFSGAYQGKK